MVSRTAAGIVSRHPKVEKMCCGEIDDTHFGLGRWVERSLTCEIGMDKVSVKCVAGWVIVIQTVQGHERYLSCSSGRGYRSRGSKELLYGQATPQLSLDQPPPDRKPWLDPLCVVVQSKTFDAANPEQTRICILCRLHRHRVV